MDTSIDKIKDQISALNQSHEKMNGKMEVLKLKVATLENTPDRVTTLEKAVTIIEAEFKTLSEEIGELKETQHTTQQLLQELKQTVTSFNTRLGTVGGLVAFLALLAQIYSTFK